MIDEIERVRRFRADEPEPTDAVRAHARAALDAAIGGPKLRRQRPGRRWWRRAALATAAVLACVLVVELASPGSDTGPADAIAAALSRLANIAASGPSLVPARGQYLYVDSRNDYASIAVGRGQSCVTYAPDHRQVWIAADGSGLDQDTEGTASYTSRRDQAICTAMKVRTLEKSTSRLWFAAGCFSLGPVQNMRVLSHDPRVLLRQVRALDPGGPTGPAQDLSRISDFLRETDASPALRAALYHAAALVPGIHLLGTVHDHSGRSGLGVAATDGQRRRQELVFNPHTAALMGEQMSGPEAGEDSWAVYLQSRIDKHLPGRPLRALTPPCQHSAGRIIQTGGVDSVMIGPKNPG